MVVHIEVVSPERCWLVVEAQEEMASFLAWGRKFPVHGYNIYISFVNFVMKAHMKDVGYLYPKVRVRMVEGYWTLADGLLVCELVGLFSR